jgi:hypothetical protein
MTRVFGEVADLYDDVRPGYPEDVGRAILDYCGGPPTQVVEIGAGTGKGTEVLLGLGAPLTAIEPDPRMATVLRAKFPQVEVAGLAFEEWAPPAGGVGLLACASAWHWTDPATRHRRAFDALHHDGALALFLNRFGYADPAQAAAIDDFLTRIDPGVPKRADNWPFDEVVEAGVWHDVEERAWHNRPEIGKDRYLALTQTFGPFRHRGPELRQKCLDGLGALLDDFGGSVVLDLRTTLVLGRRR